MINATQIRKGMIIEMDKTLYRVLEAQHITPGRWKAMIQTKLRKLKDGTLLDYRFRSEDRVEQAFLEELEMEFLYREGEDHIFMNLENYEQLKLSAETIGDGVKYLIPNIVIIVEDARGKAGWRTASDNCRLACGQDRSDHGRRDKIRQRQAGRAPKRPDHLRSPIHQGGRCHPHRYARRQIFGTSQGEIKSEQVTNLRFAGGRPRRCRGCP